LLLGHGLAACDASKNNLVLCRVKQRASASIGMFGVQRRNNAMEINVKKFVMAVAGVALAVMTFSAPAAKAGVNVGAGLKGVASHASTVHKAGWRGGRRHRLRMHLAHMKRRAYLAKKRRLRAAAIARAKAKARARAVAAAKARARAKAIAVAKAKAAAKAKALAVAKAEAEAKALAEAEEASSTGSEKVVAEIDDDDLSLAGEPQKTASAAKGNDCKEFFPAVALTVSVPCK